VKSNLNSIAKQAFIAFNINWKALTNRPERRELKEIVNTAFWDSFRELYEEKLKRFVDKWKVMAYLESEMICIITELFMSNLKDLVKAKLTDIVHRVEELHLLVFCKLPERLYELFHGRLSNAKPKKISYKSEGKLSYLTIVSGEHFNFHLEFYFASEKNGKMYISNYFVF